jgi:hypothetical protein
MSPLPFLPQSPARALFERLASETWRKIPLGHKFKCRHLETTFNDDHVFEIAIARIPGVRIYKAQGMDERDYGFDWEWWIGAPGRFWRYSVQAKLLEYKNDRYRHLTHKVNGRLQIDILDSFSQSQASIPLYCFYNSVSQKIARSAWHCPLPYDAEQLGCTLIPLDAVRPYTARYKRRSFGDLHSGEHALPWRCIVTCPNILNSPSNPLAPANRPIEPHRELPSFARLRADDEGGILEVDLPDELYHSELGGRPRAIAVISLPEVTKADIAKEIIE